MTTWTDLSSGSASWSVLETHPYRMLTEDGLYHLLTESGDLLILAYDDGSFWSATTGGSATWSAA